MGLLLERKVYAAFVVRVRKHLHHARHHPAEEISADQVPGNVVPGIAVQQRTFRQGKIGRGQIAFQRNVPVPSRNPRFPEKRPLVLESQQRSDPQGQPHEKGQDDDPHRGNQEKDQHEHPCEERLDPVPECLLRLVVTARESHLLHLPEVFIIDDRRFEEPLIETGQHRHRARIGERLQGFCTDGAFLHPDFTHGAEAPYLHVVLRPGRPARLVKQPHPDVLRTRGKPRADEGEIQAVILAAHPHHQPLDGIGNRPDVVAEASLSPAEFHAAPLAHDAAAAAFLVDGPVRIPSVSFGNERLPVLADSQVVDGHRAEVVERQVEFRAGDHGHVPDLRDARAAVFLEDDCLIYIADFLSVEREGCQERQDKGAEYLFHKVRTRMMVSMSSSRACGSVTVRKPSLESS